MFIKTIALVGLVPTPHSMKLLGLIFQGNFVWRSISFRAGEQFNENVCKNISAMEEDGGWGGEQVQDSCKIFLKFTHNTAREESAGGHSIILKFLDCMAKF